jgi:hypothetical protein
MTKRLQGVWGDPKPQMSNQKPSVLDLHFLPISPLSYLGVKSHPFMSFMVKPPMTILAPIGKLQDVTRLPLTNVPMRLPKSSMVM